MSSTSQMLQPKVIIREGEPADIQSYIEVCQKAAELAYDSGEHKGLFSKEHFFHHSNLSYWQEISTNTRSNKWWVAELADSGLILGGISLQLKPEHYEGSGFYVDPRWQRQGIGGQLMKTRDAYLDKPMLFEVFSDAHQTLAFHEHVGARRTGRQRLVHWDTWPDGINLVALEFIKHA